MEVAILTIIIIFVVVIVIIELMIYMFLRNKFQVIDTIRDSASKLDGTVSTIQTLSSNLFEQIAGLTKLQSELKLNFQSFYDMLIMKPSVKGRVGEGIVKFILSSFPEKLWKEQYKISGSGIVDFAIFMPPDDRILPMDAKFSLPEGIIETVLEEGEIVFLNKEQRKKANTLVIKRMREVTKYINPLEGTMDFALIFIPDSVYLALSNETLSELQSNRVIPVNTSGLISTLFLIERQYISIRISKAVDKLEDIKFTMENQFSKISVILRKAETQGENSNKNITNAIQQLKKAESKILESFGLLEE
ncbi:hypothetical protein LCGC14_1713190 [marine sediment metagenome]|uniref:DNA recombination protein RmuC n=1 Tax=marine sediment metagenome TaxID=412755 RepID=A0A0F9JV25_9ZZZZ